MNEKKLIVKTIHGSHLYGTNTPDSDMDYKGVYIPSGREILLGNYQKSTHQSTGDRNSKNSAGDIDNTFFSLDKFCRLCAKGDTVALDLLFTPDEFILEKTKEWDIIRKSSGIFLSRNISAYMGYLQKQAAKYGIKGSRIAAVRKIVQFLETKHEHAKLYEFKEEFKIIASSDDHWELTEEHIEVCGRKQPWGNSVKNALTTYNLIYDKYGERARQAESNENVDWKALHHATRAGYQIIELLQDHKITFPRPEKDLLLEIKKGRQDYKEVSERLEFLVNIINEIKENSTLPDKCNMEEVESIICNFHRSQIT